MNDINDEVILAARLFLATLFLIFGWRELRDYSGTVSQMVQDGVPMPVLATGVAIFMELPVAFAVAGGAFTRPSAVLLVFYSFYKNLGIMGGSCCCSLLAQENIRLMHY
jgi:putative oxidoreductase